ncbi:MAG: hypothetical protein QMD22_10300, partial [archaeon]|nr:hypothetical protein [archaeon]
MAEEKKGTPTHEEVELELGDENNEAWERWAKENKAELERMEAERERENKAEASVENKNHAAEEANKQAREEERKKEEGKATELRVMILNLLDELSIAPGKYKKRLKENYGVTKIADLTNEEKMKEVAYLQGFKERIKSEKEAKGEEEIGLEYEFTKLRDKMSLSDITHFYEWLYSEYDVTNFGALNLKDKRAVLEELRKLIV